MTIRKIFNFTIDDIESILKDYVKKNIHKEIKNIHFLGHDVEDFEVEIEIETLNFNKNNMNGE